MIKLNKNKQKICEISQAGKYYYSKETIKQIINEEKINTTCCKDIIFIN